MERPPFELRILGPTELTGPDPTAAESVVRQPKRLALLAYLALTTADGFRRRDKVIALFWPELDQSQARTYLRKALFGINEALGVEVFATRGEDEIRLDPAALHCDAVDLPRLTSEGRCHEALGLYRGDLLEGLFPEGVAQEFHEWLENQRRILREHAAAAAWECSRVEEERGDRKAAAVMARRALDLTPDDEVGVRRLMTLLDQHGDRAGALRVYSEWQARLQAEYGVEPAPETRKLARKVQAARKGESHETPPTMASVAAVPATVEAGVAQGHGGTGAREGEPASVRASGRTARVGAAVLIVAAVAVGGITLGRSGTRRAADLSSVAVLPLREIGGAGQGVEAERVTEELTTALAQLQGLTVRSTSRARDALEQGGDVDRIGRRLGVAYVVDGSVQRGPGRLRVTLRLVRTSDAVALWAGTYDSEATDPMAAAQQTVEAAAAQVRARLAPAADLRGAPSAPR